MTEELVTSGELSIGEVSQMTQLSAHTLRYYEREQLLVGPIRRDTAGRRTYTHDDVDWLLTCINLRATGMPINDMRHYAQLMRKGDGSEPARLDLLRAHQTRMHRQMTQIKECLELIDLKLTHRCDSVASPVDRRAQETGVTSSLGRLAAQSGHRAVSPGSEP